MQCLLPWWRLFHPHLLLLYSRQIPMAMASSSCKRTTSRQLLCFFSLACSLYRRWLSWQKVHGSGFHQCNLCFVEGKEFNHFLCSPCPIQSNPLPIVGQSLLLPEEDFQGLLQSSAKVNFLLFENHWSFISQCALVFHWLFFCFSFHSSSWGLLWAFVFCLFFFLFNTIILLSKKKKKKKKIRRTVSYTHNRAHDT